MAKSLLFNNSSICSSFITATFLLLNSQFDNPDLRGAQACVLAFSCVDRESFKQVELDPYLRALLLGSMYFWSWLFNCAEAINTMGKSLAQDL